MTGSASCVPSMAPAVTNKVARVAVFRAVPWTVLVRAGVSASPAKPTHQRTPALVPPGQPPSGSIPGVKPAYRVSALVHNPKNNVPQCVEAIR